MKTRLRLYQKNGFINNQQGRDYLGFGEDKKRRSKQQYKTLAELASYITYKSAKNTDELMT